MKRFYILIALFCFALSAKAQFGVGGSGPTTTGRISGTVIDSVTKKPMDYTTVGLYRSGGKSPITGVVTDEKGNFKLDNIKPGSYKLVISFIGYPSKTIDPVTTTASKPDNRMGNVLLAPGAHALAQVNVVGEAPLIENRIDKIVYNAEKDLTSAGGNATDVLQKVPLVAVDINGNVSVRGDANVRVLINGKPSGATSANLSDVLKTIPADQIKSIEVVTSPSAKYDAEGSGGIINIITKQKNISGISGSVSGGVGTRQNNGNVNLNYNKNRFSLGINAGGNLTWPQTSLTTFDQVLKDAAGNPLVHNFNNSSSRIKRHGAIGSVTAGYEFNAYNSINSTFRLNDGGFNVDGSGVNNIDNHISPIQYFSKNMSHNHFGGFDWSIDYTHKFKKEGEEITVSGQWSHSIITTDYTNLFTAQNPSQTGDNNGKNNEYTLQLDYTLPVNKVLKIEAGGKTIQRRINSNYDIFDTDNSGNNAQRDSLNSNLYDYTQNVYAGYAVFTITLPKSYSILAGGRVENTRIKGDPQNPFQDANSTLFQNLQPFSSSYTTYIPSLTIQKQFGNQTLKLSYSKRITRPSLQFLNPFINRSNIQNQSVGNPNLAPEVSQTVELGYNTFIKSSVLNFSVYYKRTNDLIEGIADTLTETIRNQTVHATRTIYQNIGRNNSFGASFFGSVNPIKPLTIRASINGYTYSPTIFDEFASSASKIGTYFQFSAFGSASYQFKGDFLAELFGFTNSARRTIQGTNPAFGIYAFGIKKQFMKRKLAVGFNTVQPFARDKHFDQNISSASFSQTSSTAFPFRSFGLTFSYSFGKTTFSNPNQQKKGVNNDDQKQGDQSGGQGGPGGR
ncbi:Outer membrane receptor proteins, mostly Fe transport [Mucilaginibacter lappiensis]|uniref:Outer membrane receptor protein involved in Fe transport n=1 Tax=Mucilaginibacter lappiensis TaxID=354630 RepID=A0ABR6PPI9_9SPHI|nr:outer membrane beta-barrel family protein [Mucilaginibacter lappiensis]MBB6111686.1 outer membrane receptor protein involved in Fe transport [Mucilaginibacter lappiensis]SIR83234.1 Outer membrane receptor proteins, mostly Fe transport [Mucilaginibacter lappiensis]